MENECEVRVVVGGVETAPPVGLGRQLGDIRSAGPFAGSIVADLGGALVQRAKPGS